MIAFKNDKVSQTRRMTPPSGRLRPRSYEPHSLPVICKKRSLFIGNKDIIEKWEQSRGESNYVAQSGTEKQHKCVNGETWCSVAGQKFNEDASGCSEK
jgi:hypothetical protein